MISAALVIGCDYAGTDHRLYHAEDDAMSMWGFLIANGCAPNSIRVLLGDRATSDGIGDRLDWLARQCKYPDQTALLFFSGHGMQYRDRIGDELCDQLDEAIVPADYDSHYQAIDDDYLHEIFCDIKGRLIMIMDCCYSGGVLDPDDLDRVKSIYPPMDIRARALGRDLSVRPSQWLKPDPGCLNRLLISASREGESALDGVFTSQLINRFEPGHTVLDWMESVKDLEGHPCVMGDLELINGYLF
jgi:hypothetical protein